MMKKKNIIKKKKKTVSRLRLLHVRLLNKIRSADRVASSVPVRSIVRHVVVRLVETSTELGQEVYRKRWLSSYSHTRCFITRTR